MIVGIVVRLPFCSHPVCLPILFRLWAGKGTASPVELAGQMPPCSRTRSRANASTLVGDAAYHGSPLLVPGITITTRLPANAALLRPGAAAHRPPRPTRQEGPRLPRLAELAATATWRTVTVARYGRADTVRSPSSTACGTARSATPPAGWCWSANPTPPATTSPCSPPTPTPTPSASSIATPSAGRSNRQRHRKQLLGVGQARNRVPRAVERTVPFGFLLQTLVIVWYALYGYHPDDLTGRHAAEPWYDQKSEPAFEDMLAKLRRALIAARFSGTTPNQPDPNIIRDYELACAAAAA